MKLFTFKTKDGSKHVGTFWGDEGVIDIITAGQKLSPPRFKNVKDMRGLFDQEEKGLQDAIKLKDDLLHLREKDREEFFEIKHVAFYPLLEVELVAPITNPPKIICIGRNYPAHAKEGGNEPPKKPMIWGKYNTAIIGPNEEIILPKISEKVDVEVELVVVIGKKGRFISEDEALDYVAGYTIGNDVSARDLQNSDKQYVRAKSIDTFAPIGPWIVTKDEIPNPSTLGLELVVNDKVWQSSNTKYMIFNVAYVVSFLSQAFTLEPGDLIFTGTPAGVGHYQNPPVYLKKGDKVTLEIEKIGVLENPVAEEKG